MSPTFRYAYLSIFGKKHADQYQSYLLEDMVLLYLKRVLPDISISYSAGGETNPDFVIETTENILVEVGTTKTDRGQIIKSMIPHKYGILISQNITEPESTEQCVILPLFWFLLM